MRQLPPPHRDGYLYGVPIPGHVALQTLEGRDMSILRDYKYQNEYHYFVDDGEAANNSHTPDLTSGEITCHLAVDALIFRAASPVHHISRLTPRRIHGSHTVLPSIRGCFFHSFLRIIIGGTT